MEAGQIALVVAYGLPTIGLVLAAGLPDRRVKLGYVFVLLSLTVAVAALQISIDLWPLLLVSGGLLGPVILRHWFSRQKFSARG